MDTTDQSLLARVRNRQDADAWRDFFDLYSPLLLRYARRRGLSPFDAQDAAQECMRILNRRIERFQYRQDRGRFRSYLYTLANHVITDMFRRRRPRLAPSAELDRLQQTGADRRDLWDRTWLESHLRHCPKRVEHRFSPQTVRAFRLYVLQQRPVDEVCRTLDISADQVYQAKTRVTRRLREEIHRLVGDVDRTVP